MTGAGVSNAALHADISSAVTQQIHFQKDSDDDWIPWDRVLGSYNSEQECIGVGQALADSTHGRYHCQKVKNGGAWVLFY
ncbi:hypothetical protein [Nocardia sp. NPDC051463]|uniref:hypothetical protein n=1 Tax=Nocardia sp. NPDC051463 TaxID=3154845 RepID=UPI00344BC6ED